MSKKPLLLPHDLDTWRDFIKGAGVATYTADVKKILPQDQPQDRLVLSVKAEKDHTFFTSAAQYYLKISDKVLKDHLEAGQNSCLPCKTLKSVNVGNYNIDATLDLHGYKHETAHQLFERFVLDNSNKKHRMLLVITGKGKAGTLTLNQMLPSWINVPIIRQRVLYFSHAALKHGGKGAFYILLKRVK